ncbi:hypothetical protein FEM48_Zijuj01G0261900 [Ziziphus jujuba var. spinosa]|uniref:Uncharacterized protein n=1 Tax=Ziziphus jujuba var. spinosa TaxID=714518 RepID=A0A978W4X9_ZIZJJ|nr:hypothetical protein FEM48_Zijuj01G0261900 [Ziziphus jujuba var. spinosa]
MVELDDDKDEEKSDLGGEGGHSAKLIGLLQVEDRQRLEQIYCLHIHPKALVVAAWFAIECSDILLPQSKAVTDYKLYKSVQQQLAVDLLQRACFELINNIDTDDDLDEYLFTRTHIELNEISKEKYPGKRVWSTYVRQVRVSYMKQLQMAKKMDHLVFQQLYKLVTQLCLAAKTDQKQLLIVTPFMVAKVVRSQTSIPTSWLLPVTKPKLFPRFTRRVVGTKLAKAIAEQVFDDKDMLTEFDMSKYNGSEFREQLTGVVKKRPFRACLA